MDDKDFRYLFWPLIDFNCKKTETKKKLITVNATYAWRHTPPLLNFKAFYVFSMLLLYAQSSFLMSIPFNTWMFVQWFLTNSLVNSTVTYYNRSFDTNITLLTWYLLSALWSAINVQKIDTKICASSALSLAQSLSYVSVYTALSSFSTLWRASPATSSTAVGYISN